MLDCPLETDTQSGHKSSIQRANASSESLSHSFETGKSLGPTSPIGMKRDRRSFAEACTTNSVAKEPKLALRRENYYEAEQAFEILKSLSLNTRLERFISCH